MKWVQQMDDAGCGIAVCAMLTGRSYPDVKIEMENVYHGGLEDKQLDAYLFEQGYFIRRVFKLNLLADETRKEWPAFPASRCIACVVANTESDSTHFVAIDKGEVFDPADVTIKNLAEYVRVIWVAGIIKPRKQRSHGQENLEG